MVKKPGALDVGHRLTATGGWTDFRGKANKAAPKAVGADAQVAGERIAEHQEEGGISARDQQGDHRREGDLARKDCRRAEGCVGPTGCGADQDDGAPAPARDAVLAGDDDPLSPGVPQVRDGR